MFLLSFSHLPLLTTNRSYPAPPTFLLAETMEAATGRPDERPHFLQGRRGEFTGSIVFVVVLCKKLPTHSFWGYRRGGETVISSGARWEG